MVGQNYTGKDLASERQMTRKTTIEHCARIAEEVAAETGDGEGEIFIARKIADRIRALGADGRTPNAD